MATGAGRPVASQLAIPRRRVKRARDPLERAGRRGAPQYLTITDTTISASSSVGTSFIMR